MELLPWWHAIFGKAVAMVGTHVGIVSNCKTANGRCTLERRS